MTTRYPDIEVELSDSDGNALSLVSAVSRALRRAGVAADEINAFRTEALSGDYDKVLATCVSWVEVS